MPRFRISYSKDGPARFISHLDMIRMFERAMRRAGLPVSLSKGFNPHARLAFSLPLPVGVRGEREFLDLELNVDLAPSRIISALNPVLPPGLTINGACRLADNAPALMAEAERSRYIVRFGGENPPGFADLEHCLAGIMAMEEINITRCKKAGPPVSFNIRPGLLSLLALKEEGGAALAMELMTGSRLNIRPDEVLAVVMEHLGTPGRQIQIDITRTEVLGPGGKGMFDYCTGPVDVKEF